MPEKRIAQLTFPTSETEPIKIPLIPLGKELIENLFDTDPSRNQSLKETLTPEQWDALKKTNLYEKRDRLFDQTLDNRGCFQADIVIRSSDPAHALATDAMTGDTYPNAVISRTNKVAQFDAKFNEVKGYAQRFKGQWGTLWEVVHNVPVNPAEQADLQAHLQNQVPQWKYQAEVAKECGCGFRVGIADKETFDWANVNLNVGPEVKLLHRPLAGPYKKTRDGLVGGEQHHTPASSSLKQAGLYRPDGPVTHNTAPTAWMEKHLHEKTKSNGQGGQEAIDYRQKQTDLIRAGNSKAAFREDIEDIKKLGGSAYIHVRRQLQKFVDQDRTFERIDLDTTFSPQSSLYEWADEAIRVAATRPSSWVFPSYEEYSVRDVFDATNKINDGLANINKQAASLRAQREALVRNRDTRGERRGLWNLGGMTERETEAVGRQIAAIDQQINGLRNDFHSGSEKLQESMAFLDNLSAWEQNPYNQEMMARVSEIEGNPELQATLQALAPEPEPQIDVAQVVEAPQMELG